MMISEGMMPLDDAASPRAWTAARLRDSDWRVSIPEDAVEELIEYAHRPESDGIPTERIEGLVACRKLMARVRRILREGVRFVVVDRLPMSELTDDQAKRVYLMLASLIARPVEQRRDGVLMYDVVDMGMSASPGSGIRPDKTNMEQHFHNDNAFGDTVPEHIGLLCIRPAREGGVSSVVSAYTLHNALRERHADVLARLYQPFFFDRQGEQASSDEAVLAAPIFAFDGNLRMRLALHAIHNGYAIAQRPLDESGKAALEILKGVMRDENLGHSFEMEAGQMQFLNNQETCHRRTGFNDWPEPEKRRHMVRLWLRDAGLPSYSGR